MQAAHESPRCRAYCPSRAIRRPLGGVVSYNIQRELPYHVGPNDPFAVEVNPNFSIQPSQRLFWGNDQGSNQVGGNPNLWTKLTNKFPFLQNMFGRMELPTQYGVPVAPQQQYFPANFQPQYYNGQYHQQFFPSGRDIGLTDDAVIVTPPHVPILPQPAPQPVPQPAPEPSPGYHYNKPQYRLELPLK
ncbi:unnamed protein product, partial [Brenthis ino]